MKLLITDLDGTLFDTREVNYLAYKEALEGFGYDIDYQYYCSFCNGRHYLDFLPQITTSDPTQLSAMHAAKKAAYPRYLQKAVMNQGLVDMVRLLRPEYKTALVTTASEENCMQLLSGFGITALFDLILTHKDIEKTKPDPQGFLKAMAYFDALPQETVIFEDSEVGLEAARRSGAGYYQTFGFN